MSRTATESNNCTWFWKDISAAKRRVLVLDSDGIAALLNKDRLRDTLAEQTHDLLRHIMTAHRTRLIAITGRSAHDVPSLLELNPSPEIWGTHGLERLYGNGRYEETHIPEEPLRTLARAEAQLDRAGIGHHIEVRLAAVLVRWSGLKPSKVLEIRSKTYRILEPLLSDPELQLVDLEEGVELRLRSATNGNALRTLLAQLDGDVPIAYLGSDHTDEDAFRTLNGRGLTVLVCPTQHFTAAHLWLRPPEDLIQFFKSWITACEVVR